MYDALDPAAANPVRAIKDLSVDDIEATFRLILYRPGSALVVHAVSMPATKIIDLVFITLASPSSRSSIRVGGIRRHVDGDKQV